MGWCPSGRVPLFHLQVWQRPFQKGGPDTQGCWRARGEEGGDRHLLGIDSKLQALSEPSVRSPLSSHDHTDRCRSGGPNW